MVALNTIKLCPHCKIGKPLDEDFQKNKARCGGFNSWCKACSKPQQQQWARNHPEKVRASQQRWNEQHPEAAKQKQRRYRQAHPELVAQRTTYERHTHPERVKARKAVYYALKTRKILKPSMCQHCGETKPLQAHHKDYSRLLDVEWLCVRCHTLHHVRNA